jgi:hypothetical protein
MPMLVATIMPRPAERSQIAWSFHFPFERLAVRKFWFLDTEPVMNAK